MVHASRLWGAGLALILLAFGCGEGRERLPASVVTGLRVLGVRAEPPEVRPLEEATLEVLAVDTEGEPLGALWIACDPAFEDDPEAPPFSPCQDEALVGSAGASAEDARALFASGAARLLGLGTADAPARYTPPRDDAGEPIDLFAALDPGDPRRTSGAAVTILVLVAPMEDLTSLMIDPEGASLDPSRTEVALKRLTLREGPDPNRSPRIEGLELGGALLPPKEAVDARGPVDLLPRLSEPERFTYRHPDGSVTEETEALVVSWFVDAGRVEDTRTREGEANRYTPPAAGEGPAPPQSGEARLWLVVRDGRGGSAWAEWPLALR